MNEVQRRVVAGAAAEMLGRGGKTAVATASGMSRNTVIKAEAEVAAGIEPSARLRAPGGGDKPLIDKQPGLLEALDELVHPETRGNPMSLLRWTSKSLDEAGRGSGRPRVRGVVAHGAAPVAPARLLVAGQRQGDRRTPASRPRRPVPLSQRHGRRLHRRRPAGDQRGHQEEGADRRLRQRRRRMVARRRTRTGAACTTSPTGPWASSPRPSPMGSTTWPTTKAGSSVGDVADTAEFAVESIRRWWNQMGRARFPDADRLLITADAGGSNGYRLRAWKVELARLAAETGLRDHRVPLPARHQQVEPDRAPHVQLHHHELAGPAPHQPAHHHRAHLRHHHHHRAHHPSRLRPRTGTPPASRSATPNSPPSPSPPTTSTANGTTPSTLKQTRREPLGDEYFARVSDRVTVRVVAVIVAPSFVIFNVPPIRPFIIVAAFVPVCCFEGVRLLDSLHSKHVIEGLYANPPSTGLAAEGPSS